MSLSFSSVQDFMILMQDNLLEFYRKYDTYPINAYLPHEDFDNFVKAWRRCSMTSINQTSFEGLYLRRGQHFELWGITFYRSPVSEFDFGCPQRPDHLVGSEL